MNSSERSHSFLGAPSIQSTFEVCHPYGRLSLRLEEDESPSQSGLNMSLMYGTRIFRMENPPFHPEPEFVEEDSIGARTLANNK